MPIVVTIFMSSAMVVLRFGLGMEFWAVLVIVVMSIVAQGLNLTNVSTTDWDENASKMANV